mgnify:CR=1 FL=1
MIRIYLDWNIISKLKTHEFADIKRFFAENSTKISIPFSPAHFEDISKSDSPNNTKLLEDIITMDTLCQSNHMAYDKELDIAAPYIATPSQYYTEYKSNNVSIETVTNPAYLSSMLAEIDHPIIVSMINHFLDIPINSPTWDMSTTNPVCDIFAKLQDVSTVRELICEVMSIIHRVTTDKETYKTLRGAIDPKLLNQIQGPSSCILPALDQILMQVGSPMGFMDMVKSMQQKQDNGNKMSLFTTAYILLDMLYRPDKLRKKGNNATNVIIDAMHAYYGAFCDYFVTDDKRLADKAGVLFYEFKINTPIIASNELISTLSPLVWNYQDSIESIIVDIIESTRIENRDEEYGIYDNDTDTSWIVSLDKYYFNFFNYANVCIGKNEQEGKMAIHLYRRFKGLSHYVFYSEVEQLLDSLSRILGEIPEAQKEAIKHCHKDASFIWSSTDKSVSILIREDEDYKGRPELIFIINMPKLL